jgi:hypothetical protein
MSSKGTYGLQPPLQHPSWLLLLLQKLQYAAALLQQDAQRHNVKHTLMRGAHHAEAARMLLFLVAVTCFCCLLQGELLQQMAINRARLGLVLQVRQWQQAAGARIIL